MKRLFIAAPVLMTEPLWEVFLSLKKQLSYENISWAKTQHLHLTYRFIGDTPEHKLDGVVNAFTAAITERQYNVDIAKTGIFGSYYNPKVIWAGIQDNGVSKNIHNAINVKLEEIGIYSDRQNFVPHLTLARIKKLSQKKQFQTVMSEFPECSYGTVTVSEITLYESVLLPEGAKHIPVHKISLNP